MATQKYLEYIESDEWDAKRSATLERDDWTCQECGGKYPAVVLHVHHKTYVRLYNEPLDDLITLCEDCHEQEHRRKREKEEAEGRKIDEEFLSIT